MLHVIFFDSKKELYEKVIDTIRTGDYIFMSGDKKEKRPLWHTVTTGRFLSGTAVSLKIDLNEEEEFYDSKKKTHITTNKTIENKTYKLGYQHGFRIDQERIFSKQSNFVKKYSLKIHPMSKSEPLCVASETPAEEFLNAIQPGDYVMVWSREDENDPTFLHYPVQGWLWSKDEESGTIEFIHPPRMDIQKFKCNDPKNPMIGFGYYRKLVFQLKNLNSE